MVLVTPVYKEWVVYVKRFDIDIFLATPKPGEDWKGDMCCISMDPFQARIFKSKGSAVNYLAVVLEGMSEEMRDGWVVRRSR